MPRGAGVTQKAPKPTQTAPGAPNSSLFSRFKNKPANAAEPIQTQYTPPPAQYAQQAVPPSYVSQGYQPSPPMASPLEQRQPQAQRPPIRPSSCNASTRSGRGDDELDQATMDTLTHLEIDETESPRSSFRSGEASESSTRASSPDFSCNSSAYNNARPSRRAGDVEISQMSGHTQNSITNVRINETDITITSSMSGGSQYPQSVHSVAVLQNIPPQDEASQERSALARKAALFKNSRLPPTLDTYFTTSLQHWSLVCRAAQASNDCYGPEKQTRRGVYTAADSSKNTKAMTIDVQDIDGSQFIILAIRGTATTSLADWTTNKSGKLVPPTGFLDDDSNLCHEGFLQVSKAMVAGIASQLQSHPDLPNKPGLLITGHSAGGAVATMLYVHMLSSAVSSELTALRDSFASLNCITFGAPPVSVSALTRPSSTTDTTIPPGIFLTFSNEGDPVTRISNTAYAKSLVALLTASTSVAPPPTVKVVHRSRGSAAVYKPAPVVPWEELPLWPTPPASLVLAGDVVLLRDAVGANGKSGSVGGVEALKVTEEDMKDVIFGDLAMHGCGMYIKRVKEAALGAMTGMMMGAK